MIKAAIDRMLWQDILMRATNNPIGEDAIIEGAANGEYVIREENGVHKFPIREDNGRWREETVLVGPRDVARYLHVHENVAAELCRKATVPVFQEFDKLLYREPVYLRRELDNSLMEYSGREGMNEAEASLELGLELPSFQVVRGQVWGWESGRYIKEFLDSFRDHYLPRLKTWGNRTSMLMEFINNYNREADKDHSLHIRPQMCEIEGCGNIASDQCVNEACRQERPPRFVCPAHGIWVKTKKDIRKRPDVVCAECGKMGATLPFERI